jgi:adenine deaminase
MIAACIQAIRGKRPFDLLIRNVQIINVFNASIAAGSIGLVGDRIAWVGPEEDGMTARRVLDGAGRYALPGFVDAHMHLESSMLLPHYFAKIVLGNGTTTVAADPHEIANVLGLRGVQALRDGCCGLPLRVLLMAPSTVPSAPEFEDSGYFVGAAEAERLLDEPGVYGLGEVMDFNGVADGEEHILSVVDTARQRGCLIDGHASVLTGRRLQAFRAAGIDSDHTVATAEKLHEELALGFSVQVQDCMLHEALVQAMNEAPVQDRICLVTDDVPLPTLMRQGHLNHVVANAVRLGLDPIRAVRYATINPAQRLRLYDVGGIAPGMTADIQLVEDLQNFRPTTVLCSGQIIVDNGTFLTELPAYVPPEDLRHTVRLRPLTAADFAVTCPVPEGFRGGHATANLIHQDGVSFCTTRIQRQVALSAEDHGAARVETGALLKMAVFNRYGKDQHGLALIDGMDGVSGAMALTYGHDAHNLTVYGGNDADMALAANAVLSANGGLCTVQGGQIRTLVPLPIAGLLSEEVPERLLQQQEQLLADCRDMGFVHARLMSFFTLMPLAVSPEIKCTDHGLLDVVAKRFLPLIEQIKEDD